MLVLTSWRSLLAISVIWPTIPIHGGDLPSEDNVCCKKNISEQTNIKKMIKVNHSETMDVVRQFDLTFVKSDDRAEFFSASRILVTSLQSSRTWSISRSCLLSKHEPMIFSTWWCKKLLNGYLMMKSVRISIIFICRFQYLTYSKNRSIACLIAPSWISRVLAAALPIDSRTEMNSTIWKWNSQC
jgi:hypothetical protein